MDYRKYLADFYQEKKKTNRHFSYRFFAHRAGIKSPVFLKQVIDGERNLTRGMVEKFCVALNLNIKEIIYFKNLVLFNQAKNASEKNEAYRCMLPMMEHVNEFKLSEMHCCYFEKWYYSVIRELVCLCNFQDDFESIANVLIPNITANDTLPKDEKNVSGITMGVSKVCYDVLLSEILAFKERIKDIVTKHKNSTFVYQLAIQLFPLSGDVKSCKCVGVKE